MILVSVIWWGHDQIPRRRRVQLRRHPPHRKLRRTTKHVRVEYLGTLVFDGIVLDLDQVLVEAVGVEGVLLQFPALEVCRASAIPLLHEEEGTAASALLVIFAVVLLLRRKLVGRYELQLLLLGADGHGIASILLITNTLLQPIDQFLFVPGLL